MMVKRTMDMSFWLATMGNTGKSALRYHRRMMWYPSLVMWPSPSLTVVFRFASFARIRISGFVLTMTFQLFVKRLKDQHLLAE